MFDHKIVHDYCNDLMPHRSSTVACFRFDLVVEQQLDQFVNNLSRTLTSCCITVLNKFTFHYYIFSFIFLGYMICNVNVDTRTRFVLVFHLDLALLRQLILR